MLVTYALNTDYDGIDYGGMNYGGIDYDGINYDVYIHVLARRIQEGIHGG